MEDNDLSNICLKQKISNGENDKKYIYNNENWGARKNEESNGSLPRNARGNKKDIKNKYCIFETKKYSHIEKKIFKELDYVDFLKNNRTISDKVYKNIVLKKCGIKLSLPLLLLFLLSISLILDLFVGCGIVNELYQIIIVSYKGGWIETLRNGIRGSPFKKMFEGVITPTDRKDSILILKFFSTIIYFLSFFVLGITIMLGIVYYHKKVKKYEKIKFRKK
ncbi:Plasmodium exported protein (Pm-fam-a like), unknown function [Plasmodium malariae]|uniref:Fam-l protein n=1 Tax=Plasmodium malariae TaxID=5858 RepID=A0A1A8WZT4_PLAMA|nr:Plasmodium exported protein (Pm-fam-a like), unknown function [Plasmodium malariae]